MSDLALHGAIGWVSSVMGPARLHEEARRAARTDLPGVALVLRRWAESEESMVLDEETDREDRVRHFADIRGRHLLYGDRSAS